MRLIDADRLKEVFSRNVAGGNAYFDLIDNTPTAEAISKDQYEARLKADLVAMLTEIQLEIEELDSMVIYDGDAIGSIGIPIFSTNYIRKKKVNNIIQQKINELKGEEDGNK